MVDWAYEYWIHPCVASSSFEIYHQCYDATLALALALNKTIEGIAASQMFFTDTMSYRTCIIVLRTEFQPDLKWYSKRRKWKAN